MTARPVGGCRVETVRPTKARLAEDGVLGTASTPLRNPRGSLANRIEDISAQSLRQTAKRIRMFGVESTRQERVRRKRMPMRWCRS